MRRSVLVVDDHASFRVAASALLRAEGFDVVGEASDGGSAVALARLLVPDIVLLDVQLPEIDGFAVAVRLSELADPPAVVLVKSRDATTYGSRVAAAGVAGFLDKRALSGPALAALLICPVGVVAGRHTRCDYLVAHLPTN